MPGSPPSLLPHHPVRYCLVLAMLSSCFVFHDASSQNGSFSDSRYSSALENYNQAEFQLAQDSLESLVADSTLGESLKQRTFKLLSQVYLILRDEESARAAMREWILLTPPAPADPDRDMPAFVKLYYNVSIEINEENFCPEEFTAPDPCQFAVQLAPGVKTVAVIDFENLSVDDAERLSPMSRMLSRIVLRHLQAADRLIVVERALLEVILEELHLNQTDAVNPATAVRIGHILGAHAILGGEFMHLDGELDVSARLIEVETSRVLLAASETGKLKAYKDIVRKLSDQLVKALDTRINEGDLEGQTLWANTLEATLRTSEGTDFFDRGNLIEARQKFEEALELDPAYILAKDMLKTVNLVIAGEADQD